jgi:putative oxidoreductase
MRKPWKVMGGVLGVTGRVLLCMVFVAAAVGYTVPNFHNVTGYLAAGSAASDTWLFAAAVLLAAAGCLSVVVGYKARVGAFALLVFLAVMTYHFHGFTFWTLVNDQARHEQVICLLANVAVMGAMALIVANGAGRMSLDRR